MGQPNPPDVLQHSVGSMGHWQARISVLMAVLKLPIAWFQLSILILEAPTEYWCRPPQGVSNVTSLHDGLPLQGKQDECTFLDAVGDSSTCKDWEYSKTVFTSTIVSEWNLVCAHAWLSDLTQATFMLGVLLGNVLFGVLADRVGRKKPLVGAIALQAGAGVVASFVPWFWAFIMLRFLLALATGGIMIISFVIVMEVVGDSWRGTVAILYQIPFTLGICFMAGVAYMLRSWRHFQLALSCISLVFLLYWWFIPESPRWLLAVGRRQEAIRVLEAAARTNGRDVTAVKGFVESQPEVSNCPAARAGVLDLLRTKRMAFNTLALFFNWFVAGLSFFGLSQCMGAMGGDIFLNISLAGLIGLPGTLAAIYVVKLGRRKSILMAQVVTGAACLLVIACPRGSFPHDWPRLGLSAIAFTALSLYLPALYLFSGELFPTVVRNAGMGSASMFSRLGSIIAPFVKSMGTTEPRGDLWPMLIIGGGPLVAAIVLSFLPETQGCPLPDTIEDGESFSKRRAEDRENCNYIQVPKQELAEIVE